ncbi:MAG: DUF4159 domain-containing protein [Kiritimatiellaeota bacterium]|nr:DUF4159 domain-containing protein [Kiritimatiellota bacterium]
MNGNELTRRGFIKLMGSAGLATAFLTPSLLAAPLDKRDDMEPFHWARLKFTLTEKALDEWNVYPWADELLLDMLQKYTSLNVDRDWHVASLDKLEEMVQYPFIFMTSENKFNFAGVKRRNFKEYLERGGFIYADDCVIGRTGDKFFLDLREKVERLFGKKMVRLPNDHQIYRSFYKLDGLPYPQGKNHGGWALFLNGRMALFSTPTDIHCGWASLKLSMEGGNGWFPKKMNYDSIKMGINIVVYAMTH